MKLCSRKWTIVGIALAVIIIAGTALNVNAFSPDDLEAGENVFFLFFVTMGLGILAGSALVFAPDRKLKLGRVRFCMIWSWLVFAVAPLLNIIAVERLNGNFISELINYNYIDNYVICMLVYALIFALSGSIKLPVFIMSPLFMLFGTANMYVKEFKGAPLLPMDFKSVGTAATVAGGYTYDVGYEVIFSAVLTITVICLAIHTVRPEKGRVVTAVRCIGLIVPVLACFVFYKTDALVAYGYKPDLFNENRGFENKGAILEFTNNTRYIWLAKPENYKEAEIEGLVKKGAEKEDDILKNAGPPGSRTKPNIIVIMDESFSDLRKVGNINTDEEVMPFIKSLAGSENVIEGNAYISVLGTGTSNTEYEFLTGNNMAFLPLASNAYQLYVQDHQEGLAETLTDQGYAAKAFHPYFGSNWNRENVYQAMGFEDYVSIEDMFGEELVQKYKNLGNTGPALRRLLKIKYPDRDVDEIVYRQYVSDDYDFREVEKMYEKRDKKKPFFLFNVTMQNHSPYDYPGEDLKMAVNGLEVEEECVKAEQYLACVKETDRAFGRMISYFQKEKEPVIILFFGDHQPNVEDEFVNAIAGKSTAEMTDEELQKRYITDFVLWANYDIPEGHIEKISMNYLQALLLQTAGLELPDYQKYLAGLYQDVPVITAAGCFDSKGSFFKADEKEKLSEELWDRIQDYRKIAYKNLRGKNFP